MRQIKFRGRVPDTDKRYGGKIVYGSLVIYLENEPYSQGYPTWISPLGDRRSYPIEPDSVAQLVGYDLAGNEVYEGDIIIDSDGNEMPAMLFAIQFDGKLKEDTE